MRHRCNIFCYFMTSNISCNLSKPFWSFIHVRCIAGRIISFSSCRLSCSNFCYTYSRFNYSMYFDKMFYCLLAVQFSFISIFQNLFLYLSFYLGTLEQVPLFPFPLTKASIPFQLHLYLPSLPRASQIISSDHMNSSAVLSHPQLNVSDRKLPIGAASKVQFRRVCYSTQTVMRPKLAQKYICWPIDRPGSVCLPLCAVIPGL